MVFPKSDEVAKGFGLVTDEDRMRWATNREKRKLAQKQQKQQELQKAPGRSSAKEGQAMNMARQSIQAQLRSAHNAKAQASRDRNRVEVETIRREINVEDNMDRIEREQRGDDGYSL